MTDLKDNVQHWVEIKRQLAEVRKDVKVLNDQEKKLRADIEKEMATNDIDTLVLPDKTGKVTRKVSQKKSTFNRKAVKNGLTTFFGGNEAQVEGALTAIDDTLEVEEKSTVSLRTIA